MGRERDARTRRAFFKKFAEEFVDRPLTKKARRALRLLGKLKPYKAPVVYAPKDERGNLIPWNRSIARAAMAQMTEKQRKAAHARGETRSAMAQMLPVVRPSWGIGR
jgi:hypothetical protein